jgi:diguanylate cyclase (GGDEF)-like protein/PAS domain S-box-containing protein
MASRRITILGALILAVLTLVAGVVVFAIMQHNTKSILSTSLELSLQSRARVFQSSFDDRVNRLVTIATRPFLIQQINNIDANKADTKARLLLQRGLNSFLPTGFSALEFLDADGKEIAHAGTFVTGPDINVPLKLTVPATLMWKGELIFNAKTTIRDHGKTVGFIRSQARMPTLNKILSDVASLGKTGELAVCAPLTSNTMQCFPTTLHPEPFTPLRIIYGERLPMDHALSGESGVARARDYRRQDVVAAYMPLSTTGLGMVLKTDESELFYSVKHQLITYVLPALGVLVLLGIFMLRWLVSPLVQKVFASERQMRKANALLADKETRIRAVFDNVDDGIIVINVDGIIESVNPGAERAFCYDASEMVGQDIGMLMPEATRTQPGKHIGRYLETGQSTVIGAAREVLARRKDGTSFPMDLRVTAMRIGDADLFIGTMRDITERKQNEERIVHLATHDALTDLPNRHLMLDRVRQAISHAERHEGTKVALLFIDLDGFKQVNDNHGHDVGDFLLVEVSKRIRGVLRSEDTIARQGGDEFIVTLPNIKLALGASVVAEKLLQALASVYYIDGHEIHISASIGLALYPDDGVDVEMLLNRSDTAMYAAKMAGRGVYRFYDPEMRFLAGSHLK